MDSPGEANGTARGGTEAKNLRAGIVGRAALHRGIGTTCDCPATISNDGRPEWVFAR